MAKKVRLVVYKSRKSGHWISRRAGSGKTYAFPPYTRESAIQQAEQTKRAIEASGGRAVIVIKEPEE